MGEKETVGSVGKALSGLLAVAALALSANATQAAPTTYTAEANAGGSCLANIQTGPAPTSATLDCNVIGGSGPTFFGSTTSAARAQPGSVGAAARATSSGSILFIPAGAIGTAAALPISFSWIGSGPAPTGPFTTSLNLELEGTMGAQSGSIDLIFEVLNGSGQSLGAYRHNEGTNGSLQRANTFAATSGIDAQGSVSRREFDLLLTTLDFGFTLSDPLEVTLRLTTNVIANQNVANVSYADFLNSATFAKGQNVFNLPDGFTANSGSWLVNNRFVTPGDNPGTLPEPGTLVLLALGLAGVAATRRRKQ